MSAADPIRFCNNPLCERCDEHLRSPEVLRKAGREVCPSCHEELVIREARPRPRLQPTRPGPARSPSAARIGAPLDPAGAGRHDAAS